MSRSASCPPPTDGGQGERARGADPVIRPALGVCLPAARVRCRDAIADIGGERVPCHATSDAGIDRFDDAADALAADALAADALAVRQWSDHDR